MLIKSEQTLRDEDADFLNRVVIQWVKPEYVSPQTKQTKQQSMKWRYSNFPRPKRFGVQKSDLVFWDPGGAIIVDYLVKTVTGEYHSALITTL